MLETDQQGDSEILRLRAEVARLNKMVTVLMDRAERSTDLESCDFSAFQATVMLEEQVQARTAELTTALRENERISRALRESDATQRMMIETLAEGVMFHAADGRIVSVNAAAERIVGRSRREIVGCGPESLPWLAVDEDGAYFPAASHPAFLTLSSGIAKANVVMGICKADGVVTWASVNSQPMPTAAGSSDDPDRAAVVTTWHDISERIAAESALRGSEAKFSAIFGLSPEPLSLTRLRDGRVLDVSDSFVAFFGFARDELLGRSPLPGDLGIWLSSEERSRWKERLERDGSVVGFETSLRRKDGSIVTALVSGKIVRLGDESCVISDAHDISEQKRHERQLERIAHHDPLTGLPNRLLLGDRMRQAIAQNQRAGTGLAVCYLDLDGFKRVNDTCGHEAGDRLLVEVAARLKACVRAGDTVARLGGDEFVLLLGGLKGDDECCVILDRVVAEVGMPIPLGAGSTVQVSASMGVTRFPEDCSDTDLLLRHADEAMYDAKRDGKNRYRAFGSSESRCIRSSGP